MTITPKSPALFFPNLTNSRIPVGSVSSTVNEIQHTEISFRKETVSAGYDNFLLNVLEPNFNGGWDLENLNPEIATLSGLSLTKLSNGICKIRLSQRGWKKTYSYEFSSGLVESYIWQGFTGTSVTSILANNIRTKALAGGDLGYFANYTQGDVTASRNSNCWLKDVDLSGSGLATDLFNSWSTANSGVLITPRHYIGVNHWVGGTAQNMGAGKKIKFVSAAGVVYTRTVLAKYVYPNSDLFICVLDSNLPSDIKWLKIPGNWFVSTVGGVTRLKGLGFKIHQDKRVSLCGFDNFNGYDLYESIVTDSVFSFSWINFFNNITNQYHYLNGLSSYQSEGIVGDSGGLMGIVLANNEAAAVSLFTGSNYGFLMYEGNKTVLDAGIVSVDSLAGVTTGYTFTVAPSPLT